MSPELLDPEGFSSEGNNPTKQSDCYALGMVIYEVLSGQAPFAPHEGAFVVRMVLKGGRPKRPQGDSAKLFTDVIWEILESCWKPQPGDRPSVEAVLRGLDKDPLPLESTPKADGEPERPPYNAEHLPSRDDMEDSDDQAVATVGGSGHICFPFRLGLTPNHPCGI